MKKGSIIEVKIEDIKFPNIGLARVGERVLEVKGGLPGQVLSVAVVQKGKVNKGKILEVIEAAKEEIAPQCQLFGLCGGCAFQNIPYEYEIALKTNMVKEILKDFEIGDKFLKTKGSQIGGYRNKMEYSFGDDGGEGGKLTLGMRKKGSFYEAVDAGGCLLPHEDFGKIVTSVLNYFKTKDVHFYHRRRQTGILRHLVLRGGTSSGEILVNLATFEAWGQPEEFVSTLLNLNLENKIVGIFNTVSRSAADAITLDEVHLLYGQNFYHEIFSDRAYGIKYKISMFSFFQTNSRATEDLYATIASFAGDLTGKTIFDLYCGAGTIGLYLARHAASNNQNIGKILGIEIVEDAVISARENAALNEIDCEFIAGDVKQIVKEIDKTPDVIILDPPREGIAPKAIPHILEFGAKKIIYVSCKPTTLAVNLPAFLAGGYEIKAVQCVDMFARTANIETVVLLELNPINTSGETTKHDN